MFQLTEDEYKLLEHDKKFEEVFNNLQKFHDRFIIIDNNELYHCGASIKNLGKKCFAINRVENEEFIEIIKKIV